MLKIYIARHGQNQDNANGILNGHRDLPLTQIGTTQANELAESIKQTNLKFEIVLTSPLQRAFQTARIVSNVNNFPTPQIVNGLIERDFGSMTGIEQSRIVELCAPEIIKTETVTYFLSPEGAETFPDLIRRASIVLEKLHRLYKNSSILIVTHGDLGKMLYAQYYGLDWQDVLTTFHFGNSELLLLSPDSGSADAHIFKTLQHNT